MRILKLLNEFVYNFINETLENVIKEENKYFMVSPEVKKISEAIKKKPIHIGIFLGEDKNGLFFPSMELLNILSNKSDKKIFVKEKSEWQFLNKKDIVGRSIIKADAKKGLVLIQNEKDENIGYGKVIRDVNTKEDIVVKNYLDRGEYLRIER